MFMLEAAARVAIRRLLGLCALFRRHGLRRSSGLPEKWHGLDEEYCPLAKRLALLEQLFGILSGPAFAQAPLLRQSRPN